MTLIDISPTLTPASPVFPGDTTLGLERVFALGPDCPVNVSRLTLSTHAGAHADAPLHYRADGADIASLDLAPYVGPCVVADLRGVSGLAQPDAAEAAIAQALAGRPRPPRVLLRFYERQPDDWDPDFPALAPSLVDRLADAGARLVGVDTASLDPATSKTMEAHARVAARDLRILENLVLDHVAPGLYELIALPLKIAGADAAPVRAVLRPLP